MKRPVTSLCRRPGKKTACGQSVPGAETIYAHKDALRRAGRSAGQKPSERGRKNSHGEGQELCASCAHGETVGNGGVWCREASHWAPTGAEGTPGHKTAPRRGPGTVRRLHPWRNGGQWGVWCREGTALGARRVRGHARAQKQPPAGAGDCVQTAPMGERRTSCAGWCLESAALGARRGRGHIRAQKQPTAGAGGCLDAGYGCYLPRAIRVIWMHRVGSTARPRIMPS